MMDTCSTCGQSTEGLVVVLSTASRRLIAEGKVAVGPLPDHIQTRLADHPLFRFGFDDFIPDISSYAVSASFRCAIKDENDHRFFAVLISLDRPHPVRHNRGDMFQLPRNQIVRTDIPKLLADESKLAAILNSNLEALRLFVIEQCKDLEPAAVEA